MLHAAYWLGILLDALAFFQMAFPELGKRMLGAQIETGPEYVFAINLGAGLMLAWTLLLVWADRKPVERRMVLLLTMIVPAWNLPTLVYGVRMGLLPLTGILPQMVVLSVVFVYYGECFVAAARSARNGTTCRAEASDHGAHPSAD